MTWIFFVGKYHPWEKISKIMEFFNRGKDRDRNHLEIVGPRIMGIYGSNWPFPFKWRIPAFFQCTNWSWCCLKQSRNGGTNQRSWGYNGDIWNTHCAVWCAAVAELKRMIYPRIWPRFETKSRWKRGHCIAGVPFQTIPAGCTSYES